ncbi:hypothetical protein [Paracoccus sp. (in: a-proteobacteria)]|uniref:hypothetical protein n=1 Tax=Paracoccus sp. TaxID=267 RepID=UPI00321F6F04
MQIERNMPKHVIPPAARLDETHARQQERRRAIAPRDANSAAITALSDALAAPEKFDSLAKAKEEHKRATVDGILAAMPKHFIEMGKPDFQPLDILAMQRAIVWIIQADAYGHGATVDELTPMMTPATWAVFSTAAREIVTRLAGIISAPELDTALVSKTAAEMAGIEVE